MRSEPAVRLGVGTLNLRQQLAILDELEVRRREDPSIEPFFDRSGHDEAQASLSDYAVTEEECTFCEQGSNN